MHIFISMAVAVLIWSLYPLAATIGLQTMTSLELIFIVYFFSGLGALLLAGIYLYNAKLIGETIRIQKTLQLRAYGTILLSGIAGALCHGFFMLALTLSNKGGVSLLYESWPVLAVITTPFLMKKSWKEVSFKEFFASVIALIGVSIIILSDSDMRLFDKNSDETMSFETLGGYILAFVGGYMCAILVVTKGAYSEHFKEMNDDFGTTLVSEVFSRGISMAIMCIIFLFYGQEIIFSDIDWYASFYIGFVVFVVGGALYTYGLLSSDNPTIHIMYYFVPVLAVIWLWMAGEAQVNAGLFIGGAIVFLSNIYLFIAGRRAKFAQPPL